MRRGGPAPTPVAGIFGATMDPLSTHTRTSPFPPDAAAWLAGQSGRTVVLVGDPRCHGPLAGALAALGYDVRSSVDGTMSLPDRSVDAIVALGEAPDLEVAARVLRPGGQVAVLAQEHDTRIPWVRKLGAALRLAPGGDAGAALAGSAYFGPVSSETFRHWEVVTRDALARVVRSLPAVLRRSQSEQEAAVVAAVELYDDYGRGPDGMQLPWLTHCHRVPVLSEAWAMVTERTRAAAEAAAAALAADEAALRAAESRDAETRAAESQGVEVTEGAEGGSAAQRPGPVSDPVDLLDGETEERVEAPAPPPPPRPQFDLGDTTEGIITYVVDTGEIPAVPAAPAAARTAPRPEPDEPDDPDLLIRFR